MRVNLGANALIALAAAGMVALANVAFFRNLYATFGHQPGGVLHVMAAGVVLYAVVLALLSLLSFRVLLKPWIVLLLLIAAPAACFMDSYNVVIDRDMLANALATDMAEAGDLMTPRLVAYVLVMFVLPLVLLQRVRLQRQPWRAAIVSRLRLLGITFAAALTVVFVFSAFFATLVREHKPLRYYANPVTPVYAAWSQARRGLGNGTGPVRAIGQDAHIPPEDVDRELVVMVVGETARADRFSLNGYPRVTNPLLGDEDVFSFSDVTACGTSTAVSVPCMFAASGHDGFSVARAAETWNALDVLTTARVHVLWRDNNSSSKGVSERVETQDFRDAAVNPVCDLECRDEGMLGGLQDWVDAHGRGDLLIVLHQMGSHGPSYYRRYPEHFRHFTPTCDTAALDDCSLEEIGNTYDNTILYTDYFLSRVIAFLRTNDDRFETAMFYVGDHGESLGEFGAFLHGLPGWMAPEAQLHVPLLLWFGRNYDDANRPAMRKLAQRPYTHDVVFHTLLGLFETESAVYDPAADLISQSRMLATTQDYSQPVRR